MLGVPAALIERHGAVSRAVAEQMALGALSAGAAQAAIAVTGIAGPDGGSSEKPVGLVWFALAVGAPTGARVQAQERRFQGDRETIRRAAVAQALRLILEATTQARTGREPSQ